MNNKTREFWITNTGESYDDAYRELKDAEEMCRIGTVKEIIHVIEYNALLAAQTEVESLKTEIKHLIAENSNLRSDAMNNLNVAKNWGKEAEKLKSDLAAAQDEIERLKYGPEKKVCPACEHQFQNHKKEILKLTAQLEEAKELCLQLKHVNHHSIDEEIWRINGFLSQLEGEE